MARFENVLLVDDDPITLMVCERTITRNDFASIVKTCKNGEIAIHHLEHLCKNNGVIPDIMFLDINMPVMNGWGFLDAFEHIRPACADMPRIFILSSTLDPEDYKKARSYTSVENFILKPLTKESLEQIS